MVHPKYLDAINECYTPDNKTIAEAQFLVDEFEKADSQGLGAIKVKETMIDKPVYLRAKRLLQESLTIR
ncbi:hypothetical protein D3C84_998140 [compost metagenome]